MFFTYSKKITNLLKVRRKNCTYQLMQHLSINNIEYASHKYYMTLFFKYSLYYLILRWLYYEDDKEEAMHVQVKIGCCDKNAINKKHWYHYCSSSAWKVQNTIDHWYQLLEEPMNRF